MPAKKPTELPIAPGVKLPKVIPLKKAKPVETVVEETPPPAPKPAKKITAKKPAKEPITAAKVAVDALAQLKPIKANKPKAVVLDHPTGMPMGPLSKTAAAMLDLASSPLLDMPPNSYGWYCWVRDPKRIRNAMPGLLRKLAWWVKVMAMDLNHWEVWFDESLEGGKPVITMHLRSLPDAAVHWLIAPELPDGMARVHRVDCGQAPDLYTSWSEAKMAIKAKLKSELEALP